MEKDLERQVGSFFLIHGLFCQKFPKLKTFGKRKMASALSLNGSPDLYVIHEGRFYAVEIKLRLGKQSEDQKVFQERVMRAKAHYFICRSMEDAANILKAIKAL